MLTRLAGRIGSPDRRLRGYLAPIAIRHADSSMVVVAGPNHTGNVSVRDLR
jgi:hypothetical protein